MLLSFCFNYIGIRVQQVINVLFDWDAVDIERQSIIWELNIGRLDFTYWIDRCLQINWIIVLVTFHSDLFDFIFHNMNELLVLPIELQSLFISEVFFLLYVERRPNIVIDSNPFAPRIYQGRLFPIMVTYKVSLSNGLIHVFLTGRNWMYAIIIKLTYYAQLFVSSLGYLGKSTFSHRYTVTFWL